MTCKKATRERITCTRPEAVFTRIKVAIVFMEGARKAECDRALDRVLAKNIPESLAVSGGPLFPLLRLVFPLVDTGRQTYLPEAQGIDHRSCVDTGSLTLGKGLEF